MAINFLTGLSVRGNIDLNGNELQNVVIHPLGTAPSSPTVGQIYYDSTSGDLHPYFFNGNTWDEVAFTSDVPTVNNSQITITAGTGLSTGGSFTVNQGSPSEITIDHDTFSTGDTAQSASPAYAGTFAAVTDLTVDNGHVTSVETTTYTMPSAFSWSITDQTDVGTFSGSNTTLTIQSGGSVSVGLLGTDNRVFNVSHDQINGGVGASTSTATPGYGQTFTAIGGITVNNEGHVSSIDTKTVTIPASDNTNTDTLQSISADTTNADRYLTSVANTSGAQAGFSHANLTYNASTETLKVKNLEVSGSTTSIQTETITLDDNIILLNSNATGSASEDAGIEVERGDDANVKLFWDESEDAWTVTNTSGTHQLLQAAGGTAGKLKVDLTVDASSSEPNVTSVAKSGNTYTVTHGLNSTDLIIQLIDVSTGGNSETVFAEIKRPTSSTITVAFGISVTDGDYRILVTQI
jgi:hypothetical protein